LSLDGASIPIDSEPGDLLGIMTVIVVMIVICGEANDGVGDGIETKQSVLG
jgi:hypothetical protein